MVGLRVQRDDVPGVQQTRDVAEHAEEDVDERVGGADAGFDPDGDGGKRMARRARRMSEEHIVVSFFFFLGWDFGDGGEFWWEGNGKSKGGVVVVMGAEIALMGDGDVREVGWKMEDVRWTDVA